jgi:septal ring factor EnvC (AmiA/AmiB activator)
MKTSAFLQLEGKIKELVERCRALGRERDRLSQSLEQKVRALSERDREVSALSGQRRRAIERVDLLLKEFNKLGLPPDGPD